jgi:hypothetical protein
LLSGPGEITDKGFLARFIGIKPKEKNQGKEIRILWMP